MMMLNVSSEKIMNARVCVSHIERTRYSHLKQLYMWNSMVFAFYVFMMQYSEHREYLNTIC